LNLLEDQGIDADELARLREMLVQKDTVQKDLVHKDIVQKDPVGEGVK
jgi:hypothetical protein